MTYTNAANTPMPTLMLRGLSAELVARITAYGRRQVSPLGVGDAASRLLEIGLEHLDARTAGARALNNARTPDERSAASSKAAVARWDQQRAAKEAKMTAINRAIRENFPGATNRGLRARLRRAAEEQGTVHPIARCVALTAGGRASLDAVECEIRAAKATP